MSTNDPFAPPADWDAKRRAARPPGLYSRVLAENEQERQRDNIVATKARQREGIGAQDQRGIWAAEKKLVRETAPLFTEADVKPKVIRMEPALVELDADQPADRTLAQVGCDALPCEFKRLFVYDSVVEAYGDFRIASEHNVNFAVLTKRAEDGKYILEYGWSGKPEKRLTNWREIRIPKNMRLNARRIRRPNVRPVPTSLSL